MKSKSKKVLGARTGAELARHLERSEGTVSRWLRRDDWPVRRSGPWTHSELHRIRAWMETLSRNPASDEPTDPMTRKAKLKILLERGQILELDRKNRSAGLIDRKEAEQRSTAQCELIMRGLMTIVALAPRLEGLNLQEREQILEAWAKDTARKFETATIE